MKKVLGMGNALIDNLLLVENEDLLQEFSLPKGSMQLIDTERYCHIRQRTAQLAASRTTGGSACNTVLAVANLCGEAGLIGCIGKDRAGKFFAENCRAQSDASGEKFREVYHRHSEYAFRLQEAWFSS